jgi:outer membrane protein assembly factor BamB
MTSGQTTSVPVVRGIPGPSGYMCGLTWDGTYLWHSDQDAREMYAIEPATGKVARTLHCGWIRADLAYHDGLLYQVGGRPKRLVLVDPETGQTRGQKAVQPSSGRLCGIEMGPAGMWMCLRAPAVVQLRDLETMSVLREHPVEGSPSGLTYVDGVVVYSEFDTGAMRAVDATTGELLATVSVEGHPTGTTWDGEHIWYCDFSARTVKAVRPRDVIGARVVGGRRHG